MKKARIGLIIPILLLASILAPVVIHPTHAVTGEVCLADPNATVTPCPASPPVFDGPRGQQIRIGVFISGSDTLNGFGITLSTNIKYLVPVGTDLTGTVLPGTPTVILECLQGVLVKGNVCAGNDNVTTLHFIVTGGFGLFTNPPTSGLLFTAIYNITGTTAAGGVPVAYQTGCGSNTSLSGGTCVTISNGSTGVDAETAQAASFDNSNSATMAAVAVSANATNFGPEFPGSNTATVTATAVHGYPGFATDAVTFTATPNLGLTATLSGANPCTTTGTSCSVTVTITSIAAGNYSVTVSGTYATLDPSGNPDTLVSSVTLHIVVNDFLFTIHPTSVTFHSGSTGVATIALSGQNGFAGTVSLSTGGIIPVSPPLTIGYSSSSVTIGGGNSALVNATFSGSPNATTTYHAIIKATSGTRIKTSPILTIVVTTGTVDFSISANPTSILVPVRANGTSTILISSLNGFKGNVSLTASVTPSANMLCNIVPNRVIGNGTATLICAGSTSGVRNITVTGTSGGLIHSAIISFTATGNQDFSIAASPTTVTITGGVAGTSTVSVVLLNGFVGTVTLSLIVPNQLACSVSPAQNSGGTSVLSCSGSQPGTYTVIVSATSGLLLHAVNVVFIVTSSQGLGQGVVCIASTTASACPFSPPVIPGPAPGTASQVRIAILIDSSQTLNGFDITLVTNSSVLRPAGVSLPGPGGVLANTHEVVKCIGGVNKLGSTSCAPTDTSNTIQYGVVADLTSQPVTGLLFIAIYNVTSDAISSLVGFQTGCTNTSVVGGVCVRISNGATGYVPETALTAKFSNLPYFGLTPSAKSLVVAQGGTDQSLNVTIHGVNGFGGTAGATVNLGVSSTPPGPIVSMLPSSVTITAGLNGFSWLNVTVPRTAPPGNYTLIITGTNGNLPPNIVTISLTIIGTDFSISTNPTVLNVNPGSSATGLVLLSSQNGFSGVVSLSATVTSPDVTVSIVPSTLTLNPNSSMISSTITISTSATTTTGTTIIIIATSGPLSHTASITLNVHRPTFTITALPGSVLVMAGTSTTSSISVTSVDGFVGTVTLSTSMPPTGLNVSLSPLSLYLFPGGTRTSTATILASLSIAPGQYTITLTATNGTLSKSTQLIVTVPPPDFKITSGSGLLNIPAGINASTTITLTSLNGFTGSINLSSTILPAGNASLPLIIFNPKIVTLTSGGGGSSTLTIYTNRLTSVTTYSLTITGVSGSLAHSIVITVQVLPPPDLPPVARFTVSPLNPVIGEQVFFDGSGSFDPDGVIVAITWDFGDGSGLVIFGGPFASHSYSSSGSFTVTLTVRDNAGLTGSASATIAVRPQPAHDVSIVNVYTGADEVVSSATLGIVVNVRNDGFSNETVTITAYANGLQIQKVSGIFIPGCKVNQFPFCYPFRYVVLSWDTTGVVAGNYSISASISLPPNEIDPTPSDNSLTDGVVKVLPPPVITITPNSGGVGTKVVVTGSGFPLSSQFGRSGPIIVTFDDMFLGFILNPQNGSFTFTFDVLQAQSGAHLVKATDSFNLAKASASFTVTSSSTGTLTVTVSTGTVYFPGDTVVVYVLTSLNGVPTGPTNMQVRVLLFSPDGTNKTLTVTSLGHGLYKATNTIASSGTIGTYAVVATAHTTGSLDASSMATFEVKLSWLSSNRNQLVTAGTLAGVLGLVGVAWKKGYLGRKKESGIESTGF